MNKENYLLEKKKKEEVQKEKNRYQKNKKFLNVFLIVLIVGIMVIGMTYLATKSTGQEAERTEITVYYSPGCSCCVEYVSYLRRKGFKVLQNQEMAARMDLLTEHQIPNEKTACHTSVAEGYFIEGHMPAEIIEKLLEEQPEIEGIALPGMPQGSPGMPGFKSGGWTIYGLAEGVSSEFMIY